MDIKPLKTEKDYRAALGEIESLMAASLGSPEGERLDVMATLVEAYERAHYPMDLPSPVDAIKFSMEQKELLPKDMVPIFGRLNRVYEVLSGKRQLTLAMIRRLNVELDIPAESLIKQVSGRKPKAGRAKPPRRAASSRSVRRQAAHLKAR
jgi:HTH-type transcriptional regulator / antitoxin HigA